MILVKMKCKQDMIIHGRNEDGSPDKCFITGNEYLFCYDEKKAEIFTYNEVKEVHFLGIDDDFTRQYFDFITVDNISNFDLDEFTLNRYKRLHKERRDFAE